uniref:Uncharacterized protein n=1 Tax=Quercus lobata TaxID=97700 RepID=A0A7N2R4D2_QUELO
MSRVDRWINLVLESEVEELALSFGWSNIPYCLPHSVLVAKSLCVLTLYECDASRPPPFGDPSAETYVDPIAAVDPPPSTSSDSSLRAMLDTVMTV